MLRARFPDADVQGIEISRQAREAAPPELRQQIALGDVLTLSMRLEKGTYDLIVCSEVLEHVEDPGAVLSAIRTLLKPGGTVLLTVPAGMSHWSVQDEAAGHLRRFEFAEFADLLRKQGFAIDRQYGWGGPVGSLYNRLIARVGPERAANTAQFRTVQGLAWLMRVALRIDDLFKSESGYQLVARASRPPGP
jgi:SAM-dependent methyltransferase